MKLHWFLLLLPLLSGCRGSAGRPHGDPLAVSDFPRPPQQQTPWSAPTNVISPAFASAAQILFAQGLADPRGGDYREIEIQVGELWRGEGGPVKTHGWVLPTPAEAPQNFAVCWNGLVYPVLTAGAPASLTADMDSLISAASTNGPRMTMALYGRAFSENLSVAADSLLPIKAGLLLRLGENDRASKVWNACSGSLRNSPGGQEPPDDPYLMLAGDWAWALFDRTICAHMRGDLPLALVSARQLAALQPQIEQTAARRGSPTPSTPGNGFQPPKPRSYLPFLDQVQRLTADLERRARAPKAKTVLEIGLTNFPGQTERIAVLIEDLDLVSARQMGQPGGVVFQYDPIVQALIQEGDAAVEPLLHCLETDQRLTRSVSFGRDFFRDRRVQPVTGAAEAALEEILQTRFNSVAEIRTYWRQNKGRKLEDRWYQTLRDDHIGQEQSVAMMSAGGTRRVEQRLALDQGQWLEAARIIVQPEERPDVPGSGLVLIRPSPGVEKPKMRGEALRAKTNPSVTELLLKQAGVVVDQANQHDQVEGVEAIRVGTELARIIFQWEKPAAAAPAQAIMRRALQLFDDPHSYIMSSGTDLARYIAELTDIRADSGDPNALTEYAAWIKSADEKKVVENAVAVFEPLCHHPGDPPAAAAAQWLFTDPASPWSKLPWPAGGFRAPLDSDLVKLPAFRRLLAGDLENQTNVGTMQWSGGNISYHLDRYSGGGHLTWPTADAPTDGATVDLRRCDWVAWSLSQSKQIPFFNPFAPVDQRDAAIRQARAVLLNSHAPEPAAANR